MKAMVCEMCQSNDLIKQDGYYVCQNCGTKYSVEDAKKLLVEGTVKIDNTEKINNLYVLARQARKSNDSENAVKYYDLIKQEDPNSWEACFFNVYYRAIQTKILYIQSAANSITNCLDTVFNLIKKSSDSDADKKDHVLDVAKHVLIICTLLDHSAKKTFVDSATRLLNSNGNPTSYAVEYANRALAVVDALFTCGNLIERDYSGDTEFIGKNACELWKSGIEIWKNIYAVFDNHASRYQRIKNDYVTKILKYDSNYQFTAPTYAGTGIPAIFLKTMRTHSNSDFGISSPVSSGGGCYVATAVYGSYDCPEVWTLRRYRDYHLAETWYGRVFIRTYYAVSPTLVKWFGHTEWFKKMWRGRLDNMVRNLQRKGFEASPYKDREW